MGTLQKKTQTSLFYREHTDLTRATLMFAEKESASLVVVRRLDDGKEDSYTNTLITDCPSALIITKATTAANLEGSGILVLASPGPNAAAALKFGSKVAKSMNLKP